jgi:hypothetical protein
MADRTSPRLVPAQPEFERADQPYFRRTAWRWVGLFLVVTVVGSVGYWYKETRKADLLRAQIISVHEKQLAPISRAYSDLRDRLEALIVKAAHQKPESYVDPRLNLDGLRAGKGLYLLLPINRALSKELIARASGDSGGDAIARCLGVEAAPAKDLWQKGSFLLPSWLDEARQTTNVMRLRVIDDELARRIRRDLPSVTKLLHPDWFLLVIQLGKTRQDAPVDVFLWDLRSGKNLLSARIQAEGMLVPVRFSSKGAPPPIRLGPDALKGSGAADCSIAAQVKTMTGRKVADFESLIQPPKTPSPDGLGSSNSNPESTAKKP